MYFETIILILGMFAASSFRIFPSLSRIVQSFQKLKYSLQIIEEIEINLVSTNGNSIQYKSIPEIQNPFSIKISEKYLKPYEPISLAEMSR
jgi:hypothetical protein